MSIEWDSLISGVNELKTVGPATDNARRANSVRTRGTNIRFIWCSKWRTVYRRRYAAVVSVSTRAGGWHGDCTTDDHISSSASDWLQQAVHAARNQHHDQEARQTETWRVLIYGSTRLTRLDLHRGLVSGRQHCAVPGEPVQSVRVADWEQDVCAQLHQRLHDSQQFVVRSWRFHETRLRLVTEVQHCVSLTCNL